MLHKTKEILFSNFLNKWNNRYSKIFPIIRYISTYPELKEKLNRLEPLDIEKINDYQLEWVSLIAQFDNPIDTSFFKEHWVPIQKNQYDYFIDLSSDSFSLFEIHYYAHVPYNWHKVFIFKNINQLMQKIDDPQFDLDGHFQQIENEMWDQYFTLSKESNDVGFAGKIEPEPIKKDDIICEEGISDYIYSDGHITFHGVNSLIVALIPFDYNIILSDFNHRYYSNKSFIGKIKNIKSLVYWLQNAGYISVTQFSISFDSNNENYAKFMDNTFVIKHSDKELLKSILGKYNAIKNG